MSVKQTLFLLVCVSSLAATGCRVDSHKRGDSDNVKIATPFGGMQVKTNDAAVQSSIGLPIYPGATLVKNDKDNAAADVNMSFGSFQFRVKAVSYRTEDSSDKVQAFYRDALGRFGGVILCSDSRPVGTPTHTPEGLTCDTDRHSDFHAGSNSSKQLQLKAGSQQHQHIVALEQDGSGTKLGLVALDLPGHLSIGDKHESSQ